MPIGAAMSSSKDLDPKTNHPRESSKLRHLNLKQDESGTDVALDRRHHRCHRRGDAAVRLYQKDLGNGRHLARFEPADTHHQSRSVTRPVECVGQRTADKRREEEGRVPAACDLAIVGGGINGCGIARDAAGRGLAVYLCEMDDLASGTSSQSTKLIHGGLRYLEHGDFRLVRGRRADAADGATLRVHR
jgi:hypothetical protein